LFLLWGDSKTVLQNAWYGNCGQYLTW